MKKSRLIVRLRKLARKILHFIFPKTCHSCGSDLHAKTRNALCLDCKQQLQTIEGFICKRCGKLLENGAHCYNCRGSKATTYKCSIIRSAFVFNKVSRSLIHALKYHHATHVAKEMGFLMKLHYLKYSELHGVDVVIPVPLHSKKLKQREYNQSQLLAESFCFYTNLPLCLTSLKRTRNTLSQTRLDRASRIANMQEAFECIDNSKIKGKTVLLIDDVATTGSTLEGCAIALKQAGAKEVFSYTFARE